MTENLYTPIEAAEYLKIYYKGKPNGNIVKKAISDGKLEYIKYSKNYIVIEESELIKYKESMKCREPIKDYRSGREKIQANGALENIEGVKDIGSLAASIARNKLKTHLSKSSSARDKRNVVEMT